MLYYRNTCSSSVPAHVFKLVTFDELSQPRVAVTGQIRTRGQSVRRKKLKAVHDRPLRVNVQFTGEQGDRFRFAASLRVSRARVTRTFPSGVSTTNAITRLNGLVKEPQVL